MKNTNNWFTVAIQFANNTIGDIDIVRCRQTGDEYNPYCVIASKAGGVHIIMCINDSDEVSFVEIGCRQNKLASGWHLSPADLTAQMAHNAGQTKKTLREWQDAARDGNPKRMYKR